MIYLDNNATTRPTQRVRDAMSACLADAWHNPSSTHRPGQAARALVERSRRSVARLLGCDTREIVFTSGGTESITLAFASALRASGRRAIVTTPIEHEAVRGICAELACRPEREGGPVEIRLLPVSREGVVDASAAGALIDDSVALVSVQWANNETGAVQPVGEIARLCRERGALFHTDATQWVGKAPVDLGSPDAPPIDLLTCSAHKFHGPKGVGALFVRRGVRVTTSLHGTQESGRRGGTENVPGIVGMGAAADEALSWLARDNEPELARLTALRDRFEAALLERCEGARVNGPRESARRLWNTTNIMFPGLESETLLMLLSERGVCASAGAACASGSLEPSPVLGAMGLTPDEARSSVRFSLSRETTEDEIGRAIEEITRAVVALVS